MRPHTPPDAHGANAPPGDAALLRAIGSLVLAAAVVNIIVGGGIFRMPAALAAQIGAAAPLALLAGALAIVPIALCFAAVGSRIVATGGPYSYAEATFGPFAGFVAGALMWISNVASSAGVAAALSVQLAHLVPALASPPARAAAILAVYALIFALNARGVRLGARAVATLAALKLAPLFALAGVGLLFVDWPALQWPALPPWSAFGTAMVLVMFAYSGMETALIPSGELRDPARNVPRATLAAIALVVLLYLGLQLGAQALLGPALARSGVPLADAAAAAWAPGRALLLATACVSMLGFLLGNLLGTSRLVFALARDGYLPRVLARVDRRFHVPLPAIALHAGLACALALGGSFDTLAIVSGGGNCLVYVLVCVAAWRAQHLGLAQRGAPFVLPGGIAIPLLSVLAMLLIVVSLSAREWLAIGVSLAVLVLVYAVLRRRARAARPR